MLRLSGLTAKPLKQEIASLGMWCNSDKALDPLICDRDEFMNNLDLIRAGRDGRMRRSTARLK